MVSDSDRLCCSSACFTCFMGAKGALLLAPYCKTNGQNVAACCRRPLHFWRPDTPTERGSDARANDDAKGAASEPEQTAEHAAGGRILGPYLPLFFSGKWRARRRVPRSGGGGGTIALVAVARHTGRTKIISVIGAAFGPRPRVVDLPRTPLADDPMIFQRQLGVANVTVAIRAVINKLELLGVVSHGVSNRTA